MFTMFRREGEECETASCRGRLAKWPNIFLPGVEGRGGITFIQHMDPPELMDGLGLVILNE